MGIVIIRAKLFFLAKQDIYPAIFGSFLASAGVSESGSML